MIEFGRWRHGSPVCWAGVALLALPSALAAQAPGHFASQQGRPITQDALSIAMGRCLLDRDRAGAIAFVTVRGEPEERAVVNRTRHAMVACLRDRPSATLDRLHLAGAIAEGLLAEDQGRLLAHAALLPAISPVRVASGQGAAAAALACAVSADPADAVAMLRVPAESEAEAAAFGRLAPSLQACVPAEGAVRIKPFLIRATVAVATYRAASHMR